MTTVPSLVTPDSTDSHDASSAKLNDVHNRLSPLIAEIQALRELRHQSHSDLVAARDLLSEGTTIRDSMRHEDQQKYDKIAELIRLETPSKKRKRAYESDSNFADDEENHSADSRMSRKRAKYSHGRRTTIVGADTQQRQKMAPPSSFPKGLRALLEGCQGLCQLPVRSAVMTYIPPCLAFIAGLSMQVLLMSDACTNIDCTRNQMDMLYDYAAWSRHRQMPPMQR